MKEVDAKRDGGAMQPGKANQAQRGRQPIASRVEQCSGFSSPIRVRIKSTCRDITEKDEGSRLIDLIKTASLEKEDHRFQKLFDCEDNLRHWAKKSTDAHEYRAVRSHCRTKVRLASLE